MVCGKLGNPSMAFTGKQKKIKWKTGWLSEQNLFRTHKTESPIVELEILTCKSLHISDIPELNNIVAINSKVGGKVLYYI